MPKALFFDIDGTLIDSYHQHRSISPAVAAELARVQALGHKIFLSSGRPPLQLTPEILEPGFDGHVLLNGGLVELDGTIIYEERMGYELAERTVDFLERSGYEYLVTAARNIFMKRENTAFREFFAEHGDIFTYEFDMSDVLERAIKTEALVPVAERPAVTQRIAEELGPQISCDGHGGHGTFELYPSATSKAKGIGVVLEQLGLTPQDAYAFGDGTNDLEMIRFCGTGVAMANGEDAVKLEADLVCPPVWEDGLAQVLRELF